MLVDLAGVVEQQPTPELMYLHLPVDACSKRARIAGPTFAKQRVTVQVLDEITAQIHR